MTRAENSSAAHRRKMVAHTLPMLLFVALLALRGYVQSDAGPLWRSAPEFWLYPLQTFLCGALLIFFRRDYRFQPLRRPIFTCALALFVFVLWISPQQFFHFSPRTIGFNPDTLAPQPALYLASVLLRFLRLVVVVPLVEEVFWRAFLLRFLITENFETISFGTFSWLSFLIVTAAFCFSHSFPDWPAALVTGALYNFVAYRTRSLTSCVLAHSLTNLTLGLWIMATKEWGFW